MKTPVWDLFDDKTKKPIVWTDHKPNPRFAIYNFGTPTNSNDDLVLDRETGLIWPRNANLKKDAMNWLDANTTCRELVLANRIGWRLPTVEELSSLIDRRKTDPALPAGHPFVDVKYGSGEWAYWTSTVYEEHTEAAWFVNLGSGGAGLNSLATTPVISGYVWPVRGGRGGVCWG